MLEKENIKCCMEFTNEEIINFLVNPLKKYPQLDIRLLSNNYEELSENTTKKIECIVLDGDIQDFSLSFYGHLTTLLTPVKSEKIMFFDDRIKKEVPISDLYGNIFYEGILSDKTNKEVLELFLQFVEILIGTTKIEVAEMKVTDKKDQYSFFIVDFIIKIWNETNEKKQITIENITFIINEE